MIAVDGKIVSMADEKLKDLELFHFALNEALQKGEILRKFLEDKNGVIESQLILNQISKMIFKDGKNYTYDEILNRIKELLENEKNERPGKKYNGKSRIEACIFKRPCPVCKAVKGAVCFDPKRKSPWVSSVHYARRDRHGIFR